MFKNRLAKLGKVGFLHHLASTLAPADENIFRQARELKGHTTTPQPIKPKGYFTAQHQGSI